MINLEKLKGMLSLFQVSVEKHLQLKILLWKNKTEIFLDEQAIFFNFSIPSNVQKLTTN